jgi:hypothetical protein
MIAQTYTNALLGYFGTDDPTLQGTSLDDAAAILAKVANKDEITIEMVEAINARIAAENQDNPTLAALAPTDDLTIATTSTQLATDLAGRATALQQQESDQGLGPIY